MRQNDSRNIFLTVSLDRNFFSRLQEEEVNLSELAELGILLLYDFEKSGRCFLSIEREKVSTSLVIQKSSYLQIFNYCFHSFRSFDSLMEDILHNVYLGFYLGIGLKSFPVLFDKHNVFGSENFFQLNNGVVLKEDY
ncbi:hypothetical protein LIX31_14325 [Leptospira kirschneri]|uniref:hypothetical protein n=1 Tax=Leptospira kirschneri TaxID=29507 RepID=UPI0002784F10|nr:hypothetical protein [Leptospira kirschneri]EJO71157.1 hypothetical protein LEP1GSC044_1111 [Leptospira kirschneri serovar Grippotyphosa str. RM52]WBF94118.1 hypothetical protein LIX31_14325 [Leptospira kirschneri]